MKLDEAYFFVFAFPLGLAAFGLWIYMRDQINKFGTANFSSHKIVVQIPCIPFIYFKMMSKEKWMKGLIILLLFWVTLLSTGFLIHLSNQHTIQSIPKNEVNDSPTDTN
jgi:hypothetical protein